MKFSIFKRLTFGYATILLLVVFLGLYVTVKLNQLNGLSREIASVHATRLTLTEHVLEKLFSQISFEKKYLISKDADFLAKFWEIQTQITAEIEKLKKLLRTQENKKLLSEIESDYGSYLLLFRTEVDMLNKNPEYPRRKFQEQKERLIEHINQRLKKMIQLGRRQRDQKINESNRISSHVLRVTTITAGMAVLIGLLISFFNTRSINRSILLLQKKTREIAKGRRDKGKG